MSETGQTLRNKTNIEESICFMHERLKCLSLVSEKCYKTEKTNNNVSNWNG
jgi:hypothetical protein